MAATAERMKAMRLRRRGLGLREIRLMIPDAGSLAVRQETARQIASLERRDEHEVLEFIEAIGAFDDHAG